MAEGIFLIGVRRCEKHKNIEVYADPSCLKSEKDLRILYSKVFAAEALCTKREATDLCPEADFCLLHGLLKFLNKEYPFLNAGT